MGQLRDRSQFYYSMATMMNAGVALSSSLRQSFPGRFQGLANRMYHALDRGESLSDAIRDEDALSPFERAMMTVGEKTGKLPDIFHSLAQWYESKHRMRQKMVIAMFYPLFVYHVAGPLLCIIDVATGKSTLTGAMLFLICWTLLPWACWVLYRLTRPVLQSTEICGRIVDMLPVIGALQFKLESANFFKSLGMGLDAGMGAFSSIQLAAGSCVNQSYRKRYSLVGNKVAKEGCSFSEAFASYMTRREKASAIGALLRTGEESGQLAENCEKLAVLHMEEASGVMNVLVKLAPALFYAALGAYLVYRIISFYAAYVKQINSLL